jgi:hypothetical protein
MIKALVPRMVILESTVETLGAETLESQRSTLRR